MRQKRMEIIVNSYPNLIHIFYIYKGTGSTDLICFGLSKSLIFRYCASNFVDIGCGRPKNKKH
jgi:hypothetical protein